MKKWPKYLKDRLKITTLTTREKIMVRIDGKSKLNGNMYTFEIEGTQTFTLDWIMCPLLIL